MHPVSPQTVHRLTIAFSQVQVLQLIKLHDILLTFHQGQYAITADISKAFHRILVNEQDQDYLKFLWFNLETEEQKCSDSV